MRIPEISNEKRFIPLLPLIILHLCGRSICAEFAGGTGEPNDPFQITTAEQLTSIGWHPDLLDKHYVLVSDIDLDPNLPGGQVFDRAVIAPGPDPSTRFSEGTPFRGTFDGNGFVIRNMTISGKDYLGLFGRVYPDAEVQDRNRFATAWRAATVRDLGLVDVDVRGTGDYVGALVGENYAGLIEHCYSTGRVTGDESVGGLVGLNHGALRHYEGILAVGGYESVGGLAGLNRGDVGQCHSTCEVTGYEGVGGLVGFNLGGSSVRNSYSTGRASGHRCVGGLVGQNDYGSVRHCYSTSTASGNQRVGGLLGLNSGSYGYGGVFNCYSTGSALGHAYVGGLVGETLEGHIDHCYSTGTVSGQDHLGGLLGHSIVGTQSQTVGTVTNCFWDRQTSTLEQSDGGEGLSTAEMQTMQTFLDAGWDFLGETQNGVHETWQMPDETGYPVLSILNGYEPPTLSGQGTAQDPYLISTVHELAGLVYNGPGVDYRGTVYHDAKAYYRLTADMDLSGITWSRAVIPWFSGHFDGNGFTIQNLTISGRDRLGLFDIIETGGEVQNLGVVDVNVMGTGRHIGALVGRCAGALTNCFSTGTVSGNNTVGGLLGVTGYADMPFGEPITGCYSTCTVSGADTVGGLVGYTGSELVNCYSTGPVSGNRYVGGLAGTNFRSIAACLSTSPVSGQSRIGGLVGRNNSSSRDHISNSYCTGVVSGHSYVGELVGENEDGDLIHCHFAGSVIGPDHAGGLVGMNAPGNSVSGCFSYSGARGRWSRDLTISINTFLEAGWDFVGETANGTEDIWWYDEDQGYPRLWWEE